MNAIIIPLTDDILDKAFLQAEHQSLAEVRKAGVLYRSGPEDVEAAAIATISKIQDLVKEAARKGWEAITNKFNDLVNYIKDKARSLGEKAIDFERKVLGEIKEVMNNTYDLLLGTLRNEIKIGDKTYIMNAVEISHSLQLSGSLEVSLTTLCKFVASGEIVISGSYTVKTEAVLSSGQ